MTEAEGLTCRDPQSMLRALAKRLPTEAEAYACACCPSVAVVCEAGSRTVRRAR